MKYIYTYIYFKRANVLGIEATQELGKKMYYLQQERTRFTIDLLDLKVFLPSDFILFPLKYSWHIFYSLSVMIKGMTLIS